MLNFFRHTSAGNPFRFCVQVRTDRWGFLWNRKSFIYENVIILNSSSRTDVKQFGRPCDCRSNGLTHKAFESKFLNRNAWCDQLPGRSKGFKVCNLNTFEFRSRKKGAWKVFEIQIFRVKSAVQNFEFRFKTFEMFEHSRVLSQDSKRLTSWCSASEIANIKDEKSKHPIFKLSPSRFFWLEIPLLHPGEF